MQIVIYGGAAERYNTIKKLYACIGSQRKGDGACSV